MGHDRRHLPRPGPDRRCFPRVNDYRTVRWRQASTEDEQTGVLVEWSRRGLALITEGQNRPTEGSRLIPHRRPDLRGWRRPAIVTRIEALPGGMHLVVARFGRDSGGNGTVPPQRSPVRPARPDKVRDRRRSSRWSVDKPICWRIHRGRRIRYSRVVERSLDGFVLDAESRDLPHDGSRLRPGNREQLDEFGFRSAVVRRIERLDNGHNLIFAEIEA